MNRHRTARRGALLVTAINPDDVYNLSGFRDSPVGTPVCRSGRTTCVEPGDSGGSNFSFDSTGNFAEGMTSAAQLSLDSTGRLRCQQAFGRQNVSWFFPVADSIAFYGGTLMTL